MTNVEELNIATNRVRVTAALALANELMANERQAKSDPEFTPITEERLVELQALLRDHADEMKAIYYTLRLNGAEESQFPERILELGVDDICIAVQQVSETEVKYWNLPAEPEAAQ